MQTSSSRARGRAFLLAGAVALSAPVAHAAPRPDDAVDTFVADVMRKLHVPGVGVAVVRAGKVEKLRGYGLANLEWQTPVAADTRFQLASTTKLFTGTLLMLLVQDGKLALADPIGKYLPDAPPAWKNITIAHLAAHASGIAGNRDDKAATVADAYRAVRARPPAFSPGARSDYGGGDFDVLVHILERVSGQPFVELVRTRVWTPLGLTCTSFDDASQDGLMRTARVIPHRASVYGFVDGQQQLQWFLFPAHTYAMGGAYSCLSDLAKWAQAMDRGTLLTTAGEARAATPFALGDGSAGEFGVVFATGSLRGRRRYGHSGGPALADVVRLPDEKLTVIVLANQQRLNPNLAPTIAGLFLPPPTIAALADTQPELTKTLRAVAAGYAAGQLDDAAFAPSVRAELVPELRVWGPVIAGIWPAIDRWTLVDESQSASGSVRRYAAQAGKFSVRWTFTLDDGGRILQVEPKPD